MSFDGYAFDIYPYNDPNGTRLVRLTPSKAVQLAFRLPEQGFGMADGQIIIHSAHADATAANFHKHNLVKVVAIQGETETKVGGFFLEEGDFAALSTKEAGGRLLSFRGPNTVYYLERAILREEPFSEVAEAGTTRGSFDVDGMWTWTNIYAGQIMVRGMEEGFYQPGPSGTSSDAPLADATWDFDRVNDSNGNAWSTSLSGAFDFPWRTSILDVLISLIRGGLFWRSGADLDYHAYDTDPAVDRTSTTFAADKVRFAAGENIVTEVNRDITASVERTAVLVTGSENTTSYVTGGSSDVTWIGGVDGGITSDTAVLASIGAHNLDQREEQVESAFPLKHIVSDDETNGGYIPFIHYVPGDLVTLHTGTGDHDFNEFAIPVAAVRILHDSAGNWFGMPELGAQSLSAESKAFEERVNRIIHQPGGHSHPPNPELCPLHSIYNVTKLYRFASNAHEFGVSAPSAEVLHTHTAGSLAEEETPEDLGTVGPFENGSVGWYFKDTTCGSTFPWDGSQHVTIEHGPLAAGPEAWKPALPDGAYRLYFFDGDTGCSTTRGAPGTGDGDANFVVQIEPAPSPLDGGSKAERCGHLHNVEDLLTQETDTTKRLAPDGNGGIEWAAESSGLPWFNVKDYGAVGDGTTDDTSAINAAIAAYNSAGGGVLYFPMGHYQTTGALTSIAAGGTILGDGHAGRNGTTEAVSRIDCSSATASLFTFAAHSITIRELVLVNDAGSTPTAGAGITVTAGDLHRYQAVSISGFYIDLDIQDGGHWSVRDCYFHNPVRYGIKVAHVDLPDSGGWVIDASWAAASSRTQASGAAGLRIESAGGGKINNFSTATDPTGTNFDYGISLAVGTGVSTVALLVANSKFELFDVAGIHIASSGTGSWMGITLVGIEIGAWADANAKPIVIDGSAGGTLSHILIDDIVALTEQVSSAHVVELNTVDHVTVGQIEQTGFVGKLTTTSCTNITDNTVGSVSDHGGLTGLADDDHTQYLNQSRHDALAHTGVGGEILVSDTPAGTPLVFADLLQNEAQDDLLYEG